MKTQLLIFAFLSAFLFKPAPEEAVSGPGFQSFIDNFSEGYQNLNIPALQLSYETNFESIASEAELEKQKTFFEEVRKQYGYFDEASIPLNEYPDYLLLGHEIDLNLERIELELKFHEDYPDGAFPRDGIYHIKNGKDWYRYYLRKWLGADVVPEALFDFGLYEVHVVADAIANIRQKTGMEESEFYEYLDDPVFFAKDSAEVQAAYEEKREIVSGRLGLLFHNPENVKGVNIAKGENQALSQVPGYYSPVSQTFYYNLFDKPYNKRQYDLLFIHEGSPGHHFQSSIAAGLDLPAYRSNFQCYGYLEGWAAYVEELGKLVGLYQTHWDYLGKWEWDQVRSIRVALDVGINYQGWTDEVALAFWEAYIPFQNDIALREIKRMRNWPAQVHTYKFGAAKIMRIKAYYKDKMGQDFDIRDFHKTILEKGALPLDVLEKVIYKELEAISG